MYRFLVHRLFPVVACLLFVETSVTAQTDEAFMKQFNEIYAHPEDKKKTLELARALYRDVEKKKDWQTATNYTLLKTIFENQAPDSALAKICEEKAQKKMNELVGLKPGPQDYGSDSMNIWYNNLYPGLFNTKDPQNAEKALKFLDQYTSYKNFGTYSFIGYAFERNGDFNKARENYEKAIQYMGNEKEEYHSWMFYTNFLARSGEYLKAEEYIQRMERLAQESNPMFRDGYSAEAMSAKVIYYLSIGDYQQYAHLSEINNERYSQLWYKNNANPCDPYPGIKANNAAYAKEMMQDFNGAEQSWKTRDSLNYIWVNCYNKTYPNSHYYPISLYPVYLIKRGKMNKLPKPASYYIKETEDHYNSYREYADISINYMKATHLGYLGSRDYGQLFDPILEEIKKTRNFRESTAPYINYSYFCMRDRKMDKAASIYKELFSLNEGWINDIIFSFGEKTFATYYNAKLKEGYENFHSFVKIAGENKSPLYPQLAGQAYNNLLFTKSISLKGTQRRKEAFQNANDPAINKLYEQWIEKKQQLIRQYLKTDDPAGADTTTKFNTAVLQSMQEEVTRLENELTLKAKDFKKYLKITAPDWKTVQVALKEGEAAIEIIRFNWRDQVYYSDTAWYAAYIITAGTAYPEVVYLPDGAASLDNRFYKTYKGNIKFKTPDNESYQHYWKPIQEKLNKLFAGKGVRKIFFSPDGIYHLINIATLKNPESNQYLLNELDIQYTSSGTDINTSGNRMVRTATLMGRPAYQLNAGVFNSNMEKAGTRSYVRNFKDQQIPDLPGTEEEIAAIRKEMEKSKMNVKYYLKDQATEDKLYGLHSPGILHIATHGYWSPAGDNATDGYRVFNAMANSGLLLSGVVNYYATQPYPDTYDGILTAYEAQNLDLENTSLVILSACETSLGQMDAGEGVYGLQRAFRAAGAGSIMTSLWKVDDNATRDFMIAFYQEYLKTNNKQTSFIAAQKLIQQKYVHPFFWGAFVMMGN
ncbi:MAG: CHAT domain-containing protein [Bacteroidetes bacterium]|nr:CHAT domain-containing protein [Bacteroidota bacterium]